ncbi:bifunctional 4-hydroxy-2-oxoglutarate aldolase/2-dehydro-3-deoxy-phosphogluconate aldolase [Streptomyces sp. PSKA54]|uniref:Bifunctional 4-hydroxy-2-oxoglutarate aldolase/2-dehydro-3-deoxy-phosphogluconate aldolase n=1 Tax=Streptomyces himalayensis subsp. aureolus TaxID=2758039 RepID=A0A7W2HEA7_9ACTN|nr:bifunctional 4-hydroxy-2-oxoglutarate aldolase/2-dehydro-3-deoxy-phosphogluconate aldolase [Streptomyces himalayensis]MBA4860758.1 bifunctional 4-hydroxy-2-oxoglutarate aldolase/2-dehydro-3-deoxy-phosphogluconate aldolase [Streptomyces himalayensis subsp. aureolus]
MDTARFRSVLVVERLVAIVRGSDAEASLNTVLALADEGVALIEVSLRTADALDVIARAAARLGPDIVIGAGAVLTADDVRRAQDAGAGWVVTPAVTEAVAASALAGVPVLAGALTPTETVHAIRLGAGAVQLFPASLGGPHYLAALREPLPDVPFVPAGGVDVGAAEEYFTAGAVAVGVGPPLVGDAADGGDLGALRHRARRYVTACRSGSTA